MRHAQDGQRRVVGGAMCAATSGCLLKYHIRLDFLHDRLLREERHKSETLLLNVLPAPIAARLRGGQTVIADNYPEATLLFADISGFTRLSMQLSAVQLVTQLDRICSAFDAIAERLQLEKIKTIGDAYMLVAGLPTPRADHATAVADAALAMLEAVSRLSASDDHPRQLQVRIGIHTGPVVAGVIGTSKFAYDLWGDTVNTASRMESHGQPGEIQLSHEAACRLRSHFHVRPRGEVDVKGKGPMETYLLGSRRGLLLNAVMSMRSLQLTIALYRSCPGACLCQRILHVDARLIEPMESLINRLLANLIGQRHRAIGITQPDLQSRDPQAAVLIDRRAALKEAPLEVEFPIELWGSIPAICVYEDDQFVVRYRITPLTSNPDLNGRVLNAWVRVGASGAFRMDGTIGRAGGRPAAVNARA